MVLPDTSVWVEYLRRGEAGRAAGLDDLVARREVLVCGPVAAELIAGTGERDRERVARVLEGLPWAELGHGEWPRTGEVAAKLRAKGETVPLTDIEIAVAALGAGAVVWSDDSDFERIADVVEDLELRSL